MVSDGCSHRTGSTNSLFLSGPILDETDATDFCFDLTSPSIFALETVHRRVDYFKSKEHEMGTDTTVIIYVRY